VQLRQALLLGTTVVAALLPTVVLQQPSRIFLLKVALAALLAMLPGWLYLQFIRFRGRSLYDEYVLNLFRLRIDDYRNLPAPPQHTNYHAVWDEAHRQLNTDTKDNLYRYKFEAIYGRRAVSTAGLIYDQPSRRDRTETFSTVLVATILLSLGWALVAQPELLRGFNFFSSRLPLSGRPVLPYEPIQFAFIGAYWFIMQGLIRRYFRDDLKTGAYISAAARLVLVTIIVTIVSPVPLGSPAQQKVLAFLIGVFPQLGFQVLKAAVFKPFARLIPTIKTDYSLSDLVGLSIWEEARLLEEGIEDMQTLVNAPFFSPRNPSPTTDSLQLDIRNFWLAAAWRPTPVGQVLRGCMGSRQADTGSIAAQHDGAAGGWAAARPLPHRLAAPRRVLIATQDRQPPATADPAGNLQAQAARAAVQPDRTCESQFEDGISGSWTAVEQGGAKGGSPVADLVAVPRGGNQAAVAQGQQVA
jgi:hypothetical protein